MKKKKRSKTNLALASILILLCLFCVASCGRKKTPEEILNKVKDKYAKIDTFHEVTSSVITDYRADKEQSKLETEIFLKKPNLFSYETQSGKNSGTAVSDGKEYYLFIKSKNEYVTGKAPESISSFHEKIGSQGLMNPANVVLEVFLLDGKFPAKGIESSKLETDRDKIGNVPCYVLSLAFPTGERQRLWIGTKDYLIWKNEITITSSTHRKRAAGGESPAIQDDSDSKLLLVSTETMKVIEVDKETEENKFALNPPKGAKNVPSFTLDVDELQRATLEGKEAPEFTLEDRGGKNVSLTDFKGKVVILDFWDSWCRPCAKDLKMMQQLYKAYGEKNLVILAINDEEDKSKKEKFLKANKLDLTSLHDVAGEVSRAYGVDAVPRIIIVNGDGLVSADFLGLQSEEKIKKELEKLGVQ